MSGVLGADTVGDAVGEHNAGVAAVACVIRDEDVADDNSDASEMDMGESQLHSPSSRASVDAARSLSPVEALGGSAARSLSPGEEGGPMEDASVALGTQRLGDLVSFESTPYFFSKICYMETICGMRTR